MQRRPGTALLFGLAIAALISLTVSSCGSSNAAALAQACSINSDCNSPLACAFGRCHNACTESRDCPADERCVSSGSTGVCQLTTESTCSATVLCQTGQVCGTDSQCRSQCSVTNTCISGNICLQGATAGACYSESSPADEQALIAANVLSPDGAVLSDASFVITGNLDGSGGDGSGDGAVDATVVTDACATAGGCGGDGTIATDGPPNTSTDGPVADVYDAGPLGTPTNPCPSAQSQFGNIAMGDTNPNFQSGVGARSATQLFAFSGYVGPDPAGDGGGSDISAIYAQAFDPQSGTSAGPAAPLLTVMDLAAAGDDTGYWLYLYGAAVAPTGQIALVYEARFNNGVYDQTGLYAAFLDAAVDAGAASDAGAAGLQVQKVVPLETATFVDQPTLIWSTASQSFVFSWQYETSGWFMKIEKFLVDGRSAGGDSDVVPTDDPGGVIWPNAQTGVGTSGSLFGAAYISSPLSGNTPLLTVLDAVGNEVGSPIIAGPAPGGKAWVAVAGTSQGFVYFYDDPSAVTETFFPTAGDAGVIGGPVDGGDGGAFPTFSFPGAVRALNARPISDDMPGGAGGVGVALLYSNGVSFAYVNADGVGHQGPNSIFPHTYGSGDIVSMTNLSGSFVVSLYNAAGHSMQVAASGCGQ
jgi:hypothetical protein